MVDYLFIVNFSTRPVTAKEQADFFEECTKDLPYVTISHSTTIDQPNKGVIAVVSFPDDATMPQIEAFCHAVRDKVAIINELIFENGVVLVDGQSVVTDQERHFLLGFAHLARWAHAPMRNVMTGFAGDYNGTFDPDKEDNNYVINTLKGGSGGKN